MALGDGVELEIDTPLVCLNPLGLTPPLECGMVNSSLVQASLSHSRYWGTSQRLNFSPKGLQVQLR